MTELLSPAKTIWILDPSGDVDAATQPIRPRLATLEKKVVGFMDNNKHNFDLLCDELSSLLRERYPSITFKHLKKSHPGMPAPAAMLAELVRDCDAVIAGSGD